MKKFIFLILIAIIAFTSCEKDNICVDSTTPFLTIRFYNYENPTEKKAVSNFTVWAVDKDSIFTGQTTDSISIPLDLNNNLTLYKFASKNSIDNVDFAYLRSDVYIGRSCGYKTIYEDFEAVNYSTNWIKNIEIINTIIENDTSAAVHIYH
jgi:hypothetical protein